MWKGNGIGATSAVSINSTSYKRSDVLDPATLYFNPLEEDVPVSINSTSYKRSDD